MNENLEKNLIELIGSLSTEVSNNIINDQIMTTLKKFSDRTLDIDRELALLQRNLDQAYDLYKNIDENTKRATAEYFDKITNVTIAAQACHDHTDRLYKLIEHDVKEIGTQLKILSKSMQGFGYDAKQYGKAINQYVEVVKELERSIKQHVTKHEIVLNDIQAEQQNTLKSLRIAQQNNLEAIRQEQRIGLELIRSEQAALSNSLHEDLLSSLNKKILIIIVIIVCMFILRF